MSTDPDTAASIDAAAVRVSEPFGGDHPSGVREVGGFRWLELSGGITLRHEPKPPKVWRDLPCPHHSRMMPNRHCRHCDGTERILEPASS